VTERIVLAFHESGHACVRFALRLPVWAVWISAHSGMTEHPGYRGALGSEFENVIACYGGVEAVRRYRPWSHPEAGACVDYADATRLLAMISSDMIKASDWSLRARELAAELVAVRERAVRDIAGELFRRGELSGREAHEIFRDNVISAPRGKITHHARRALRSRRGDHWRGY
jgi:hypothetical protein